MRKSVLKKAFIVLVPFLLCTVSLLIFYSLSFVYSAKVAALLSNLSGSSLSIEKISFSPLNGVHLEGVDFKDSLGLGLTIKAVNLKYSFKDLWKGKLTLREVLVEDMNIDRWIEEGFLSSEKIFHHVPGGLQQTHRGFGVDFTKTRFCFHNMHIHFPLSAPAKSRYATVFNFCLDNENRRITCGGTFRFQGSSASQSNSIERQQWTSSQAAFGFNIDIVGKELLGDFKLTSDILNVSAAGVVYDFPENPMADIKVYSQPIGLNQVPLFKETDLVGGNVSFLGYLKGSLDDLVFESEVVMPSAVFSFPNGILTVDRLKGQVNYHFKDNRFHIKGLQVVVDKKLNLSLEGQIDSVFSPSLDVSLKLGSKKPSEQEQKLSDDLIVHLQGKVTGGKFAGGAEVIHSGSKQREYRGVLKGLFLKVGSTDKKHPRLFLTAEKMDIIEYDIAQQEASVLQDLEFEDIFIQLNFSGKKTVIDKLQMHGYQGFVEAQGEIYFGNRATEYSLNIELAGLRFEKIKIFYPVYCEMGGLLRGIIQVRHKNGREVNGIIVAKEFHLAEFNPLDRVAEFIGIDSIEEIQNAQIVLEFSLLPEENIIKHFDVDSKNIQMRSRFHLNDKGWLEGKLALSLPRDVLEESKIFKKLIAISRKREFSLDFLVRLSGYVDSLRTELVESSLRDALKERLSVRVQKYIEQEINKAMESP